MIDIKDVEFLFGEAINRLIEKEAKTHKYFLTQDEFEKNMSKIFSITYAKRRLTDSIKKINLEKKKIN